MGWVFLMHLSFSPDFFRAFWISLEGEAFLYEKGKKKSIGVLLPIKDLPTKKKRYFSPVFLIRTHKGYYLGTKHRGIFFSKDLTKWRKIYTLHRRFIWEDPKGEREPIAFSPPWMAYKHNLLFIRGRKWIYLKDPFPQDRYFMSLTHYKGRVYLGTGKRGLFQISLKRGHYVETRPIAPSLPHRKHSKKFSFYEPITALWASPSGNLWIGVSFQGGLFLLQGRKLKRIPLSSLTYPTYFFSIQGIYKKNSEVLLISTREKIFWLHYREGKHYWGEFSPSFFTEGEKFLLFYLEHTQEKNLFGYISSPFSLKKEKSPYIQKALKKRLFYSSEVSYFSQKSLFYKLLYSPQFDGVVLDIKNDAGYITYPTKVAFAKKIGADRLTRKLPLKKILEDAHKRGKYVVARIVVFKDPVLWRNPRYAILDKRTKKPWVGYRSERWVDPYHPYLAKRYYMPLVKELEDMGIDEIQLDYIRFPRDGKIEYTYYSHKPSPYMYPQEAIYNFLSQIRKATSLPISIDVYGYNALYPYGSQIGQDVPFLGENIDILCPMLYSSHFGDLYMGEYPRKERVYYLIYEALERTLFWGRDLFFVRPWLQAFALKSSIWGYGKEYFLNQIRATRENGIEGYAFWGSLEDMATLKKALQQY